MVESMVTNNGALSLVDFVGGEENTIHGRQVWKTAESREEPNSEADILLSGEKLTFFSILFV